MTELKKSDAYKVENTFTQLAGIMADTYLRSNLTSQSPLFANNMYSVLTLNWTNLTYMYKTHSLVETMIDMPVNDAFGAGLELHCATLDEHDMAAFNAHLIEEGIITCMADTGKWGRLYGGAGLIVNAFDDPAVSYTAQALVEGPVKFYDANRWELGSPFRIPVNGYYNFYGVPIHESRVITFSGKRAPHIIRQQLQGWGMSELERMVPEFLMFLRHRNVLYELLEEAKVDVYKIDQLQAALSTSEGTSRIADRMAIVNRMKNYNNAIILPKDDEYEQKQIHFSGLADINESIKGWLACATGIPQGKLFGQGASGFSSGEDDIEKYNTMVNSAVRAPMTQMVHKVLNMSAHSFFGAEHKIHFKFNPLRTMSSEQEEAIKSSKHTRYASDLDRGILTPEEYGVICKREGLHPIDTAAARGEVDRDDLLAAIAGGDGSGDLDGDLDGGNGRSASADDKSGEDGEGSKKSDSKKYGPWVPGPKGGNRRRSPGGGWQYEKSNK